MREYAIFPCLSMYSAAYNYNWFPYNHLQWDPLVSRGNYNWKMYCARDPTEE